MDILNTNNLKQYLLLTLIIGLTIVLGFHLFIFFPGILGAITLYILMRQYYFRLTVIHNWKKWVTATLFIIIAVLVFVLPLIFLLQTLLSKFQDFFANPNQFTGGLDTISEKIQKIIPQFRFDEEQIRNLLQQLTSSVPLVLNATANMFSNLVLAFFLLYFMLVEGRKMERKILRFLPLKEENVDTIWNATKVMVVSNAIGIPVLAACQAVCASLGYYLFGIDDYILWGIVTGVFSLVPIVGTAVIWIPMCVYLFATNHAGQGFGLLLYAILVVTNIDNVMRFTLLKKLGDVHPVVTVMGIIVGVPLFGFMGFIFGPLLISYLLLLIQIYRGEFSQRTT